MPLFHRRFPGSRAHQAGPTRREVLQASLAAAATLLAGCASRRGGGSGPRVVIVGAGFAGLACAHELRARGADATVVEARARLGGRVHTLRDVVPGASVEAGGEFIGANHPRWLGYAERFRLELVEVAAEPGLEGPIVLQGQHLSGHEAAEVFGEVDAIHDTLTKLAREVDGDAPWAHAYAAALDTRHVSGWIDEQRASEIARHACRVLFATDMGVPTARQSLLAMLAQISGGGLEAYWTQSESYRCRGGNARLAEELARAIGEERVLLNSPAERVRWSDRGVEVTAGGRTLAADRAVIAVPPSVWRTIRFEPPLPPGLAPQMGSSVKYLATVKQRFWRAHGVAPEALSDGAVSSTWEATSGQHSERAVLTAFSSAAAAEHCRKQRGAALRGLYASELGGLFPGFGDEFEVGRFLDWPGDEWTRGGYSFPAPGEVLGRVRRAREPLGPLVFAGEHTSTRFPGYMEGALESGLRAAESALGREG